MDRAVRLRRFRLRLLTAFGLGMAPGLFYSVDVEADESQISCYTPNVGEDACLPVDPAADVLDRLLLVEQTDDGCNTYELIAAVDAVVAGECCYEISVDAACDDEYYDGDLDCGCYGRPYVAHAEIVAAPVVRNPSWGPLAAPDVTPDLSALTSAQRAALTEFWSDNARAEHSSVAGFHRLCIELIAHNAPLELLVRSQRAAADELDHARLCFALASHYAGEPLGPGPMPLGVSAPIAANLTELAVATAREGCLGETAAAWLADEMAARATDPAVRAALEQIARDELDHAELAWMTLRWAIDTGGAEVRDAVAEVFRAARPSSVSGAAISVASHGLLATAEVRAIVERGFHELLGPVVRASLAEPLAA